MKLKKINPFYWLNRGKRKLMSKYVKRHFDKIGGYSSRYYDEESEKIVEPIYPRSEEDVEDYFWYIFPNHLMNATIYPFALIKKIVWG